MRRIFLLLFFISASICLSENVNPQMLRRKFYASVQNEKLARDFLSEFKKRKNSLQPIEQGYKAAVGMVMANHAFNPYSKFKYFIDGKNELESSIKTNPDNIELRLIRFAIQSNVPSFLGYSSNIQNDKNFLLNNIHKLQRGKAEDDDLVNLIKQYLTESKHCTVAEKEQIKNI